MPIRAVDLVQEATVIDMLGLLSLDWARVVGWLNQPASFETGDYWKIAASGVDVFHSAVEPAAKDPHLAARQWIAGWNRLLPSQVCALRPVRAVEDLDRPRGVGPVGVLVGFQSSEHFRTIEDVRWFYERGQRVSQLTYNGASRLGSGCRVWLDRGLTAFGAEVVQTMDQLGMAVDVSHCGERTSRDAIEASRRPVLITHSNSLALVPRQPRNKSDDIIRAMARKGGVMGITLVRAFVRHGSPSIEDVLDHFAHVAGLVGIEHVGLGTDLDVDGRDPHTGQLLGPYVIRGLEPRLKIFQLAEGLLRRGYSRADVALVLGGNFRRALREIWSPGWSSQRPPSRDPFCPSLPPPAG